MTGLPEFKLNHLLRLTDDTGIIQHATYALPNRQTGYTTDDNARALLVSLQAYRYRPEPEFLKLAETYMAFLHVAQKPSGWFHNFFDYQRRYLDDDGSDDSFGRSLWACGYATVAMPDHFLGQASQAMIEKALPAVPRLRSLRGMAYTLLGLSYYYQGLGENAATSRLIRSLADDLVAAYQATRDRDWEWFEDILVYANAILPTSLLLAYEVTEASAYLQAGKSTLEFLTRVQWADGYFNLVGNNGWYPKGRKMALFDQQPVDAGCLVQAYTVAHHVTGQRQYRHLAETAFNWFLGQNIQGLPLYDETTGGCCDGLQANGVNPNQGAESLLAYLLSRLAMEAWQQARVAV
ncbi:MAG: glycosyltransferase [Clostridia bacterium]|nr:MAG: glycosyltransferase [Clostridia bacterium]